MVARSTAAHASVVFIKLRELSRNPVAEQARLKSRLGDAVAAGLAALAEEERIVLEAPDGAAVVVLGNPAGALDFAVRSSQAREGMRLAVGLGHGPVRVVAGAADSIVHGDGITTAENIAAFDTTGRVTASRDFRAALARVAPDRARHFAPAGTFIDANDRSHDVFFADEQAAATRRRHFLVMGAAGFAGIVGLGFVARLALRYAGVIGAPATIRFEIKPRGEVFVDGESKGMSPPLDSIQLTAGRHRIEVRNPQYPPLLMDVDVNAGEELAVRHSFASPQSQRPAWRRFIDKFK